MGRPAKVSFGKKPVVGRCYVKIEDYPTGAGTGKPARTAHMTVYAHSLEEVRSVIAKALKEAFE